MFGDHLVVPSLFYQTSIISSFHPKKIESNETRASLGLEYISILFSWETDVKAPFPDVLLLVPVYCFL